MPRLFPQSVVRARAHAGRFPRPFWILVAGEGVQSLGFGLAVPFFALYVTSEVGATPAQAGLLMGAWAVAAIVAQPLGGVLADRAGRRPVMLAGLAGAGLSAGGFAFVADVGTAAVLIVLWALFNGVFEPAAAAYVADVAPPGLRTEAFGLWRVAANAFFAVGPPLGALVIWLASFRAVFLLAGAAVLAYLAIVWRGLPESRPAPEAGGPSARFREALRDRTLLVLAAGVGLATFNYAFYEDALPVFLHAERGLSIVTWGLVFGINPVLVALLQYPIARWAARRSSRLVLGAGALLEGLALLVLLPFSGLAALVVAVVVLAAGEMLLSPVSAAVAAEIAPERLRGSYQGVLNLAWEGSWGPAAMLGLWLVGRGEGELFLALALPVGGLAALLFCALPAGRLQREPALVSVDPVRP